MNSPQLAAIVLAAGEGKRMKSSMAKVLHPVRGRAMLDRILDTLKAAGIGDVVVIVGHKEAEVRSHVGSGVKCVTQAEQLGTGHAVMQAEEALAGFDGNVIVMCGDAPLWRPETIRAAIDRSLQPAVAALVLSFELEDPTGYGRIIRDERGKLKKIVEHKDASEEERRVREVNSGTFCFQARPLFEALRDVNADNAQKEYYLPEVVRILIERGSAVDAFLVPDSEEGMGVNSPEELAEAEAALDRREGQ